MRMLPTPPLAAPGSAPPALRQAAQAFEAQALAQLLQPAFDAADISGSAFGGGAAEAQWRPMLLEAMTGMAARSGRGVGIGEAVLGEMLRMQEAAAGPAAAGQEDAR